MTPRLLDLLGVVALGAVLFAGLGCAIAVVRIVFPSLGRAADRSLEGLGTLRLVLTGILPLVGAVLLLSALPETGVPRRVAAPVVLIPLGFLLLPGAVAAAPHLGARLLRGGEGASLLARCVTGSLTAGLAMATWAVPLLGALVTLVLLGWLLGVGIGLFFRRPPADAGAP